MDLLSKLRSSGELATSLRGLRDGGADAPTLVGLLAAPPPAPHGEVALGFAALEA